jgi:hypothetical protein
MTGILAAEYPIPEIPGTEGADPSPLAALRPTAPRDGEPSATWLELGEYCHVRHWLVLRRPLFCRSDGTMETQAIRSLGVADGAMAVVVAIAFVLLVSLLEEPTRQRFMAIFVAGAGAAYLNGGLGIWEFLFTGVATYVAYRGLESYRFIGAAWVLHTMWDVAHHFYGNPIVFFAPTSSAQCAITDALIAVWFFRGAPSAYAMPRHRGGAAGRGACFSGERGSRRARR